MKLTPLNKLSQLKSEGYSLHAYCLAQDCRHSTPLDLDALIVAIGESSVVTGSTFRASGTLTCSICGSREVQLSLHAPNGYDSGREFAAHSASTIDPGGKHRR